MQETRDHRAKSVSVVCTFNGQGEKLLQVQISQVVPYDSGLHKFKPDLWFGLIKRSIAHRDTNSIVYIEYSVLATGSRPYARALCITVFAHVPVWVH